MTRTETESLLTEALNALANEVRAMQTAQKKSFEDMENSVRADWLQTRILLDLTNKRLKALEASLKKKRKQR